MTAEDLLTERLRLRRWQARDEAPMAAISPIAGSWRLRRANRRNVR